MRPFLEFEVVGDQALYAEPSSIVGIQVSGPVRRGETASPKDPITLTLRNGYQAQVHSISLVQLFWRMNAVTAKSKAGGYDQDGEGHIREVVIISADGDV